MIYLHPKTTALQFTIKNQMDINRDAIRPDGEIRFTLERMGCNSNCIIDDFEVTDEFPLVTVDLSMLELSRGYYKGYLTIGCEKTCDAKFFVGQNLCFDTARIEGCNNLGVNNCQVKTSNPCSACGNVTYRTYQILSVDDQLGIKFLAVDQCIDVPTCEVYACQD
jgi:hypothetical protein